MEFGRPGGCSALIHLLSSMIERVGRGEYTFIAGSMLSQKFEVQASLVQDGLIDTRVMLPSAVLHSSAKV